MLFLAIVKLTIPPQKRTALWGFRINKFKKIIKIVKLKKLVMSGKLRLEFYPTYMHY